MTARFMVNYDIPSDRPKDGAVLDDADERYRIVTSDPEMDDERTETGAINIGMLREDNPDATLADLLYAYMSSSGYSRSSDWTDSPYPFDETVSRLSKELASLLHGVALERNARLAKVASAANETGSNVEVGNQSYDALLDQSGEREVLAQPGLGYPVPRGAARQQIIDALLALADEDEDQPEAVQLPVVDEEVFDEREDVPRSEEGQ